MTKALLEKGDMTGNECIEIIRASANGNSEIDSENLLKTLVQETIFDFEDGSDDAIPPNGSSNGQSKPKAKAKSKSKEE